MAWLRALHRRDPRFIDAILAEVPEVVRDYPIFDMPPLPAWHSGRVVLVGDAAHAVGPHAGQGAAMAVEDAVLLCACIGQEADLPAAFRRYEALRRPRIAAVAALTARNRSHKRAGTWVDRLVRRLLVPLLVPASFKAGRALYAYRVDHDPQLKVRASCNRARAENSEDASMTTPQIDQLAETAMRWYGWGSPIGLGVFIVCLSLAGLVAAKAVGTLADPGAKAARAERQAPDNRN